MDAATDTFVAEEVREIMAELERLLAEDASQTGGES
mgnify:CR=1 FL=1